MNPFKVPFALLGLIAFAMLVPPVLYFVGNETSGMPPELQVLVTLAFPFMSALFLVSWLQPRSGVVG